MFMIFAVDKNKNKKIWKKNIALYDGEVANEDAPKRKYLQRIYGYLRS